MEHLGEFIVIFGIFCWIMYRLNGRRFQQTYDFNNFEFYLFNSLHDYYKNEGYPNPFEKAMSTTMQIRKMKNEECNID